MTLSDETLEEIFIDKIVPETLEAHTVHENKTLRVLAGQPGSGKTKALHKFDDDNYLHVIVDSLRRFHPNFAELQKDPDPTRMPKETIEPAGKWFAMVMEWAQDKNYNVLYETTLRSTDKLKDTLQTFSAAGYSIEIYVITVPRITSLLSILLRYMEQFNDRGEGRITTVADHDAAYYRAAKTLEAIKDIPNVTVNFIDRDRNPTQTLAAGRAVTVAAKAEAESVLQTRNIADTLPQQAAEALQDIINKIRRELKKSVEHSILHVDYDNVGSIGEMEVSTLLNERENLTVGETITVVSEGVKTRQACVLKINPRTGRVRIKFL